MCCVRRDILTFHNDCAAENLNDRPIRGCSYLKFPRKAATLSREAATTCRLTGWRRRQTLAASTIRQPENNSECEPLLECDPIAHCRPQPPVLFRFAHRGLVEPFEPTR